MSPGLKRLRASSTASTIAQLNRTQAVGAAQQVALERTALLPVVHAGSMPQLRAGLCAAVRGMKEDCARLHRAARGKQRERLYGEMLGYDAVLKVLACVESTR